MIIGIPKEIKEGEYRVSITRQMCKQPKTTPFWWKPVRAPQTALRMRMKRQEQES